MHGGKLEAGETEVQAAVRETREEVAVDVDAAALERVCVLDVDGRRVALHACTRWRGRPRAVERGTRVRWANVGSLGRVSPALPSLALSGAPLERWLQEAGLLDEP